MLGNDIDNPIRVRQIKSELSVLSNCDGSARVEQGSSSVLIGIWGPVEVKQSKELPDKTRIETSVRACTGHGTPLDKMYEEAVTQTCEQIILVADHPRTSIQVIVQIESNDGSIMSVIKNALCLALMDAGIPMKSMFASVSCVQLENGELAWDATQDQEDESISKFTFVYESANKNCIYSHSVGQSDMTQYMLVLQKGRQLAGQVFSFYKESFEKLLRKDVKFELLLPPIIKDEPM